MHFFYLHKVLIWTLKPTLSRCNWSAQHAKEAVGWASPGSSHGTIFLRQNQGDISPPGQFFFIWTLKGGYWFPTIKAIQAAITLGTGCSLGPEGPSVDIGKSCANGCAEMMENNREWRIALVAAGIASGILINYLFHSWNMDLMDRKWKGCVSSFVSCC